MPSPRCSAPRHHLCFGAVELTCRVYDREHLDLRLFFAGNDTAQQFRSFVPELRRKLRNSKLHLEDIAIGAANTAPALRRSLLSRLSAHTPSPADMKRPSCGGAYRVCRRRTWAAAHAERKRTSRRTPS